MDSESVRPRAVAWTVIATTGERFAGFSPYVASVDDAGVVAFQASVTGGGTGVFSGDGGEAIGAPASSLVAGVTSHPDLNGVGVVSFYGERAGGGQAAFVVRNGRTDVIADAQGGFSSIGPAGPTMNEAGSVAFRADRSPGVSGVFLWDGETVFTVADVEGGWREFHGLPLADEAGTVVFRADRSDGVEGMLSRRGGFDRHDRRDAGALRDARAVPFGRDRWGGGVRGDAA